MQENENSEFMKILRWITGLYGKTMSRLLINTYWQALQAFELIEVKQAFRVHIHNPDGGQRFPMPADIIRLIEGSGETHALLAWTKVEKAIRQVGAYRSLAFDDALIHAVLEDMGGWVKLCSIPNKQLPFYIREFQKRYRGYVTQKPRRYPKYLWGITESENARNGYAFDPPMLVGNINQAEQVMKNGGEGCYR